MGYGLVVGARLENLGTFLARIRTFLRMDSCSSALKISFSRFFRSLSVFPSWSNVFALEFSLFFKTLMRLLQNPPHDHVSANLGNIKHARKKTKKRSFCKICSQSDNSRPGLGEKTCNFVAFSVLIGTRSGSRLSSAAIRAEKSHIFEYDIGWSPPEFRNSAAWICAQLESQRHISWKLAVRGCWRTRVHLLQLFRGRLWASESWALVLVFSIGFTIFYSRFSKFRQSRGNIDDIFMAWSHGGSLLM